MPVRNETSLRQPLQPGGTTLFATGLALLAGGLLAAVAPAAPFTARDLNTLARVSDPQGLALMVRHVVYTQRDTDLEANRGRNDLLAARSRRRSYGRREHTAPADAAPRRRQQSALGSRWLGDLLPLEPQRFVAGLDMSLAGGEAQQVTDLPSMSAPSKSRRAAIASALSMEVFPDCADINAARIARPRSQRKRKAAGATINCSCATGIPGRTAPSPRSSP
jgi:hypothetical protein